MRLTKLIFVGALLPLAATAQESLDYTFVEATYLSSDLDAGPFSVDGDGLGLKGSIAFNDQFFGFADYKTADYDFGVDANMYDFGVGMRWGLQPELDLVADASWVHAEIETNAGDADDDGLGLGVGLRSRVHDKVELQGTIRYVDLEDSDTFLALGGRYYFTDSVAAGFGLDFNDNDDGWNVSLRAEFGN